ncbi:penicillin-binding protein 1A [Chitinophaga nivalis]|uniref:Transglycosylase domain-containing protein n=1 Tax=Chitinophaga nivalis TaxID=2991709 RepID=A0ABT3IRX8_9BACT|nr:transglycosylase domain-containing protein [Chitinophaga nivalis]MCW3463575.1 transglycosylase domain-containing protein [Chitinophaga nivalis]MCW3486735.1 transglycosylase domain-containing protein [Chitinophaga nivalis]
MKKSVKILWRVAFGILAFIVLFVLLINFRVIGNMPSMEELENPRAALASEVIADDGTILGKYYQVDRSSSDYNEISKNVINALIATEETRFYDNSGIDAKGTMAIPFYLLIGKKRGSSTITQQLALNLQADNLGKQRSGNPIGRAFQKLQEWIIAVKLERNFTKQEILTLYLNTVAFGDNVYGIENGARTFFSKDAGHLSIEEAAILVGMLKGNTIYNPRRNPQLALNRRNTVIDNMVESGFITPAEAANAKSKPIVLHYNKIDHNKGLAPYFREVLRDELKGWCKEHKKADGSDYNLYRDGLKVYTTINPRMQLYAEEAVAKHLQTLQKFLSAQADVKSGNVWKKWPKYLDKYMKESDRYRAMKDDDASDSTIARAFNTPTRMKVFSWKSSTEPDLNEVDTVMTPMDSIKYMRAVLQAGFMAMDPESGEVKAWVGGPDFRYFKNDHVAKTRRQVGSTFKPFLYCFAIMNGMSPNTVLPNEPVTIGNWTLTRNSEGSVGGSITMAGALARSLNLVSAYLIKQIGAKAFADFAQNKIGFESEILPYPSIALGTSELSLYEMLRAYTMFPGRGINTKPIYITRIEDRNGNILETFAPVKREVISEKESFTMVKMMQGVMQPGGTGARSRSRYNMQGEMAGKTGTTNDNTDGWFIGYTPKLLAGAWVGCENNFIHFSTTAIGQGANTGLPIWAYFMQKVYADPTLKVSTSDHFLSPTNMSDDDVHLNYESNVKPGAEAENVGNGSESDYGDYGNGNGSENDFANPGADKPANDPVVKPKEKEKEKEKEDNKPAPPKAVYPPKKGE